MLRDLAQWPDQGHGNAEARVSTAMLKQLGERLLPLTSDASPPSNSPINSTISEGKQAPLLQRIRIFFLV